MLVGDHVVTQAMWSKGFKACWHVRKCDLARLIDWYPGLAVVALYQTLHEKYGSLK